MQLSEIVALVVQRLQLKRPVSFLIEIPPTCDYVPDCMSQIRNAIGSIPGLRSRSAFISADMARDDDRLVNSLIEEWSMNEDLKDREPSLGQNLGDDPLRRIKHFVRAAAELAKRPRIAFIRRFDKVFRSMSSELLATMRSLEQEGWLVTVNSSPLPYTELYRRRARAHRGFTSDYGQSHVRVTVDPLNIEQARLLWVGDKRLGLDDRLAQAYFSTAFGISGGLPTLYGTACDLALRTWEHKDDDIREYRNLLLLELVLSPTLDRLLAYDEPDASTKLLQAVANIHLGAATPIDEDLVASHYWRKFLLADHKAGDDVPKLRTEVIGRRALLMLRDRLPLPPTEAKSLYKVGNYQGCLKALGENAPAQRKLLLLAATMMNLVFGDSSRSLYLAPGIKWAEVRRLAATAIAECSEARSNEEFEVWAQIATAYQSNEKGLSDNEAANRMTRALILLGTRVLAVEQDRNAVTAAHTAIPVIEDVLRHYALLVLQVPDTGQAFANLSRNEIVLWWTPGGDFLVPAPTERLSGTEIAVLVAAMSKKKGARVFADRSQLNRLLSLLEGGRNRIGHRVIIPAAELGKELVAAARHILDLLLAHGGSPFCVKDLEKWLRPPSNFLDDEV